MDVSERLNETEAEAFTDMHESLCNDPDKTLTERQSGWVKKRFEELKLKFKKAAPVKIEPMSSDEKDDWVRRLNGGRPPAPLKPGSLASRAERRWR